MVADGGINPQPLLSPCRGFIVVDLPIPRVAAVEGHIPGNQHDVRVHFRDFLRQIFAHPRVCVAGIAGIGKAHVTINHDAQRPANWQVGDRKRGSALILCVLTQPLGGDAGRHQHKTKNTTLPTHQRKPPPTKWTISSRSPSASPVLPHSARETILPLCSTATRSPLRPSAAIKSCRCAGAANCGNSRTWPLRTKCINGEYHRRLAQVVGELRTREPSNHRRILRKNGSSSVPEKYTARFNAFRIWIASTRGSALPRGPLSFGSTAYSSARYSIACPRTSRARPPSGDSRRRTGGGWAEGPARF